MKTRIAAEWEPAIGVLVAWPPAVPRALFQELAKDTRIYLLVPDQAEQSLAEQTLQKWQIDPAKIEYIQLRQGEDYAWPRDWGPQPLFDAAGNFSLLGPKYIYSTPFCGPEDDAELEIAGGGAPLSEYVSDGAEDAAAEAIAAHLGQNFVKLPFAFTGGNVLSDGINSILTTRVLLLENAFDSLPAADFFRQVATYTGMTNYSIFSDYEDFSLQHIDCFLKILDEHRLLVLRLPTEHPHYQRYENIVENELRKVLNSYGRPYEILRMDTAEIHREGVAAYVNALILNKNIYVPLYSIAQDAVALAQWQEAMPGYTVKGFEFKLAEEPEMRNERGIYDYLGWDPGDVLHCRTRAVWDPQMLYLSVNKLPGQLSAHDSRLLHVIIVDYSQSGLIEEELLLHYRRQGEEVWQETRLMAGPTHEVYVAELPGAVGDSIEYYVSARDHSGRAEHRPKTAPTAFYTCTITA